MSIRNRQRKTSEKLLEAGERHEATRMEFWRAHLTLGVEVQRRLGTQRAVLRSFGELVKAWRDSLSAYGSAPAQPVEDA